MNANHLLVSAVCGICLAALAVSAQASGIAQWDLRMALVADVGTNCVTWIDGSRLPLEGRASGDVMTDGEMV